MPKHTSSNRNPEYKIITFPAGKPYDRSSPQLPSSFHCPKCEKPCGRRQELGRHLLTFHLPCSVHCPYASCPWRGDRKDDLKKHLKNQGCGPLNPKREQYEIYEKNAILYWILDRGEPVETVEKYVVGVVEERALEVGKVKEWNEPWGYEWRTNRRLRNK
ncbi:hypothetical protein BGW80DRAFT_1358540 [Lactifluus volemus]|nr:hypothetical protein BGW80DRAFT_1358540 [Lactifluus volemus]